MAYEKTNWTNTTPINTANLNKIEDGIYNTNIETITNEHGTAIKFPDGTMIQYGKYTTTEIAGNTGFLNTVVLPCLFIDTNYIPSCQKMSGGSMLFSQVEETSIIINEGAFDVTSWNNATETAGSLTIGWTAIGKWK